MKPKQINLTFDNPVSDRLAAVENAITDICDALEELRGLGEYEDWFNTLDDLYDEMEAEIDSLESYVSGEQQQMLAELNREYERDLLW